METFIQENMKIIRSILDYTQEDLANTLGISRVYYLRLESGADTLGRTVAIAYITVVIHKSKKLDKDSMKYKLLDVYLKEFQKIIIDTL